MEAATNFIWNILQQYTEAGRKNPAQIYLIVENREGIAGSINSNEIHLGSDYIYGMQGDIRSDLDGVLYHEMTHVWQWHGNGYDKNPQLVEGIADFVRQKAGYAPSHWVQLGGGDTWNQGYDVTARFSDYCDGLSKFWFVAEVNKKMRNSYSDDFFVELLGKTVDKLWSDYKDK